MDTLTLAIHRPWTETFSDVDGRKALHLARAEMLHTMAKDLDLNIISWGDTDGEYPREVVEIVITVASTLIAEAISAYIKEWWKTRRVKEVEIVSGSARLGLSLESLTTEELDGLGQLLWQHRMQKLNPTS